MRLHTFEIKRQQRVGVERDGQLVEVPCPSMVALIRAGNRGLAAARKALRSKTRNTLAHDLKKVKRLAPIPRPGKILCSGLNYKSHVEEEPGAKFLEDPLGPCIVTADEIPHPEQLCLSLKLNGQTMIERCNDEWCFSLPKMIEWLTMAMTMEPGDVMTTGCPAGVGYFRNPQVFLKPGDVCELKIQPIGKLVNPVAKDW